MHLLQSGVDLSMIAMWLGHESILTTHQYLDADLEAKREALGLSGITDASTEAFFVRQAADAFPRRTRGLSSNGPVMWLTT